MYGRFGEVHFCPNHAVGCYQFDSADSFLVGDNRRLCSPVGPSVNNRLLPALVQCPFPSKRDLIHEGINLSPITGYRNIDN